MELKKIIILPFLFIIIGLNAQTDFRSGYVILNSNDTLHGIIDYRNDLSMGSICRFKLDKNAIEKIYYPDEIIGYRFNDSKYFITKDLSNSNSKKGKVFLEFLIKGKLNVYFYQDEIGDHYYIEKQGFDLIELPYEEGIKYKDNAPYYYQSTQHIGLLELYLQDAPDLRSNIESIKKPEQDILIMLARDYHNEVCKNEQCIIYEKKESPVKFSLEPLVGYEKFAQVEDYTSGSFIEYGANLYIWMPRSSEKIYFKTGIAFAKIGNTRFYKVPLQLQYVYPSNLFRPIASLGINYYAFNISGGHYPFHLLHASGGFIYKILKNTYLSANISGEFTPIWDKIMFRTDSRRIQLVSYSLNVGLYIEL